jgi:hypothetical protein
MSHEIQIFTALLLARKRLAALPTAQAAANSPA